MSCPITRWSETWCLRELAEIIREDVKFRMAHPEESRDPGDIAYSILSALHSAGLTVVKEHDAKAAFDLHDAIAGCAARGAILKLERK